MFREKSFRGHEVRKPSLPFTELGCVSWFMCIQGDEGAVCMWDPMCAGMVALCDMQEQWGCEVAAVLG